MPYTKRTTRKKPYTRPTTKRRAPRRYTRSKSAYIKKTRVHRPLSSTGFPQTITTRLEYCDQYYFSSSGSTVVQQFRLASIYDPDLTSTGHQPYNHDQFAALYSSYKVVSVQVRLLATPVVLSIVGGSGYATQPLLPLDLVVRPDNYDGSPSGANANWELEAERPKACHFTISPGSRPLNFRRTYSVPYILGIKKQEYLDSPDYFTPMGSNPSFPNIGGSTNTPVLNVSVCNPYSNVGTADLHIRAELSFLVIFKARITQGPS